VTIPDELNALIRDTLKDEDVSELLETSPKLRRLIKRMYGEIKRLSDDEDEDDGSVFPVKSGAETRLLRACDIFLFEAQGRKVALRTKAQEISFYSNFELLTSQLPGWFLRCHRGYIVNTKKIKSVNFAGSTVCLSDGSNVPFSRSYRDTVRAALEKLQGSEQTDGS
jgi:DNA-binding LytR/AlgR family response regulator